MTDENQNNERIQIIDGWSNKQRNFKLKSFTIPGYLMYACYRDAKEDPKKESTLEKIFDRFDPTLLEIELSKSIVYGSMIYGLVQMLSY